MQVLALLGAALALIACLFPTGTPTLSFRQWRQTEIGSSFDVSTVEVSTNQGVTWTTVSQVIDNSFTWVNATVSLSAYAGQMVSLRFRFNTVDSALNQYKGWYVGDIRLNGGDRIDIVTYAATSSGQPFPSEVPVQVVLANWVSAEKTTVDFEELKDPNLAQLMQLTNANTEVADMVVVKRIASAPCSSLFPSQWVTLADASAPGGGAQKKSCVRILWSPVLAVVSS